VAGVVGGVLPLALVVAVSPLPLVAVVLVVLAPKAGSAGAGFLVGWLTGVAGVTTAVLLLAGDTGRHRARLAEIAALLEVGLGVLLLAVAVVQWRSRARDGEPALPAWLAAIDRITVVRAGGLGLLLSAANPKAVLVCVAAGLVIAGGASSAVQSVWAVVLFTGVAASTVTALVLASAIGGARVARPLHSLRRWLTAHSAGAAASVLGIVGAVLVVQGAGGLG
jgi:threonine/homoserine/homoserine lactone efflux protein